MFGRKTRDEIGLLRDRVLGYHERIVDIEEALNEATRLLAKKHGLVLKERYPSIFTYSPLVRLATRTTTKHVKL